MAHPTRPTIPSPNLEPSVYLIRRPSLFRDQFIYMYIRLLYVLSPLFLAVHPDVRFNPISTIFSLNGYTNKGWVLNLYKYFNLHSIASHKDHERNIPRSYFFGCDFSINEFDFINYCTLAHLVGFTNEFVTDFRDYHSKCWYSQKRPTNFIC